VRLPRPGVLYCKMLCIVGSENFVSRLFWYRDFLLHGIFRLLDFSLRLNLTARNGPSAIWGSGLGPLALGGWRYKMESWRVSSSRSNCNNKSLSDSDPADPTDPTISEKGGQSRWLAESGSQDVIPACNSSPHFATEGPVPDIACCWDFSDRRQHAWH
jgi:hypothetical protein